jgi:leucyl aminopeptidase
MTLSLRLEAGKFWLSHRSCPFQSFSDDSAKLGTSLFVRSDVLRSCCKEMNGQDRQHGRRRAILADVPALAEEEEPELFLDMVSITWAARAALGLRPAASFHARRWHYRSTPGGGERGWKPALLTATLEALPDTNNMTSDGFTGAITAALFMQRYDEQAWTWARISTSSARRR